MYWLYLRVDMPFWFGQTHRGRHSIQFEECLRELFAQNWSLPNLRQAEEKRAAVGVSEQPFVPWTHRVRKWCSSQKKACFTALPGLYHLSSLVFMRKCLLRTFWITSHWHGTEAVIVGGGQCGMALAARLQRLGVSYIVVDQNQRPGDSWRKRHMAWYTGVEKGGGFGWNYVKGVSKCSSILGRLHGTGAALSTDSGVVHKMFRMLRAEYRVMGWIPRLWLPPLARPCFCQSFTAFSHPGPLALVAAQRSDGRLFRCLARIISHPPKEIVKLKIETPKIKSRGMFFSTVSAYIQQLLFGSPVWLVKFQPDHKPPSCHPKEVVDNRFV